MGLIINPYRYGGGGGGGGPDHIYWRLRFQDGIAGGGNARLSLQEVEMRATVSGADQCTGGTAFASSQLDGLRVPANAFDNNTSGNEWASGNDQYYNSHLGYQFASSVVVAEISVKCGSNANEAPLSIMVEHSDDGSTYTRFAEITGLSWTSGETKTFDLSSYPAAAKSGYSKHKIVVTASNDGAGDVLATEIELRATVSGADQTQGPPSSTQASGTAGFYDAVNEGPRAAFNNNTGNWWQPRISGGSVECIWDYGLDNDRELAEIRWRCHGGLLGRTPNAFTAYGWNGSSWVQVGSPVSCGTWSGSDRTFTL